jgi:hypothetical protein
MSLSVAALLAGCASRATHYGAENGGSIKDTHTSGPQMRVAGPVHSPSTPSASQQKRKRVVDAEDNAYTAAKSNPSASSGVTIERKTSPVVSPVISDGQTAPKQAIVTQIQDVRAPSIQATVAIEPKPALDATPKVTAPQVVVAPPTLPVENRSSTDLRRSSGPLPATAPPATPNSAPTQPATAAPVPKTETQVAVATPDKPAAPALVTKPSPARSATPGVSNEPGPKTANQRTLQLATLWLAQNNMANARAELAAGAKGEDPALLNALAETYDPIMLKRYPRMSGEADVSRAMDLYKQAIAKGSEPAKSALARLQAMPPKPQ